MSFSFLLFFVMQYLDYCFTGLVWVVWLMQYLDYCFTGLAWVVWLMQYLDWCVSGPFCQGLDAFLVMQYLERCVFHQTKNQQKTAV